ncbi:DUF1761 domain-containing protein [Nitratireductor sp. ZSWI3]|nr:DUF1761 domain-containing protein [Nitratireductor sp. ZSWI3]
MTKINPIAVFVATVAAFVASVFYYAGPLGEVWMELAGIDASAGPSGAQIIAQFIRELVVVSSLAWLIVATGARTWVGALRVGLVVWLGFQAMAIAGSVIHEAYPWQLYAIHSGDALMKSVLVSVILGVWRKRPAAIAQGV